MRVVVVVPPADPVITTGQAKDHVETQHDDDDALIDAYIAAVTANLDGPEGWLGRALGVQTLELRIDSFGCAPIVLPCPPHIDIVSVKYVDTDGVEQTLAGDQYELLGSEFDLTWGNRWPSCRRQREAVRIRYRAGYATLNPSIHAAMLLMIGDLYANRETAIADYRGFVGEIPMSVTVTNLLTPLRVW